MLDATNHAIRIAAIVANCTAITGKCFRHFRSASSQDAREILGQEALTRMPLRMSGSAEGSGAR